MSNTAQLPTFVSWNINKLYSLYETNTQMFYVQIYITMHTIVYTQTYVPLHCACLYLLPQRSLNTPLLDIPYRRIL